MFRILEIAEIKVGKITNYCLNFNLSLPNNMDLNRYFSVYNLKNGGRKQKFGYAKMFNLDRKFLL